MTPEEIVLLHNIKQGDERSFQEVFEKYYKELCISALFLVKDFDVSEDIVQELFVKLWEQRKVLAISTSIKSYLIVATKNNCKNYLAHQKVMKRYENDLLLNNIQNISRKELFTDPYLQNKITKSIDLLSPKCKLIFKMSRFKGYKYKEIANKLNISQKTVEAQMGKALASLHQSLKDYLPILLIQMVL